jgi:hypothetical protein
MAKAGVKPVEKWVDNYVLSTVRGMYNTYRYWRDQIYSEDHSIGNACKWGVAQLFAGVGDNHREKYADCFETISAISKSLAEYCRTSLFVREASEVENP